MSQRVSACLVLSGRVWACLGCLKNVSDVSKMSRAVFKRQPTLNTTQADIIYLAAIFLAVIYIVFDR